MKRASRTAALGSVAAAAVTAAVVDPAFATPAIPSTEPLPSDQMAAPLVPAAEPVVGTVPPVETAPLPVPEAQPRPDVVGAPVKAPLHKVDSTIPLPSDQLTPMVPAEPLDAASATTDAAIAAELGDAGPFDRDFLRDQRPRSLSGVTATWHENDRVTLVDRAGSLSDADRDELRAAFTAAWPHGAIEFEEPQDHTGLIGREALDMLRVDLASAVIDRHGDLVLSPDTAELLCRDLGIDLAAPSIPATAKELAALDEGEERRAFPVLFDVEHDGERVPAAGDVVVTQTEFERLRAGTAIAAGTSWDDGLGLR